MFEKFLLTKTHKLFFFSFQGSLRTFSKSSYFWLSQLFEHTDFHQLHCIYERRQHFINSEHVKFQITVNSNQYRLLLCHSWKKAPDSLKKSLNFVNCWVRRNFINFVKSCVTQILIHSKLLVNSANVIEQNIFFFVQKKVVSQWCMCLFAYRAGN